jgi:hypothetical protein
MIHPLLFYPICEKIFGETLLSMVNDIPNVK